MRDSSIAPRSPREVIDRWPTLRAFAEDIGVAYGTAKAMRRRNSIPDEHRVAVVECAGLRDIVGITYESLTMMHAKPAGTASEPAQVMP